MGLKASAYAQPAYLDQVALGECAACVIALVLTPLAVPGLAAPGDVVRHYALVKAAANLLKI